MLLLNPEVCCNPLDLLLSLRHHGPFTLSLCESSIKTMRIWQPVESSWFLQNAKKLFWHNTDLSRILYLLLMEGLNFRESWKSWPWAGNSSMGNLSFFLLRFLTCVLYKPQLSDSRYLWLFFFFLAHWIKETSHIWFNVWEL